VAFDPNSGMAYPIVNLMAPANHHDKLFPVLTHESRKQDPGVIF
jgi:hypothetical protein